MISISDAISRLAAALAAIPELAVAATPEQARWRPDPEHWSILEVVCHLYDEEREDFRFRLRQSVERPDLALPPIDPQGWVTARRYHERDLAASIDQWRAERQASIAWLRTLTFDDWGRGINHPHLSDMRVGDLLAAWVAHDLLHIRQLNELHYRYLTAQAAPYSVEYAGDW